MNTPGFSNTNTNNSQKLTGFIETLKQRQRARGISGSNMFPDRLSPFPFPEMGRAKELEKKRIEQFYQARSKEWANVYSAKQKQIEKRVEEIKEELIKLAKQIVKFEININQAITSVTPEPGKYHLSFLDHIKTVIELYKKNVVEANSWLSLYNERSKKISHYWGMAKKKGSSYMFNDERQLATSVG